VTQKRQRSKQRQAERRERRLAERGGDGAGAASVDREREAERRELEDQVDLTVGAPPEDLGRSDYTVDHEEPPSADFDIDDPELDREAEEAEVAAPAARGPRGVRGGRAGAEHHHERGRLVAFLVAVWAELQRVQWPNRKQLTQLTGVVLFFVLVVGAYLGALDAVFSKLIEGIL
jgi:preprotein translocase subunit SecE